MTTILSTYFSRTVWHYIRLVVFTAENATAGYTSEASTSQHSRQQLTIILSVLVGLCRRNIISTRPARRAAEASCHFRRAWWNFSSLQPISNEQPRQLGLADRAQPGPARPVFWPATGNELKHWWTDRTVSSTDSRVNNFTTPVRQSPTNPYTLYSLFE